MRRFVSAINHHWFRFRGCENPFNGASSHAARYRKPATSDYSGLVSRRFNTDTGYKYGESAGTTPTATSSMTLNDSTQLKLAELFQAPSLPPSRLSPQRLPGASLESLAALQDVLKDNHERYHIFFNDSQFHKYVIQALHRS